MLSKDEVLKLAELARVKISDTEAAGLQKDISNILDFVGQVSAADSSVAEEMPPLYNVLRADQEYSSNSQISGKAEALKEALPRREGDFAVVRKIIEKDVE